MNQQLNNFRPPDKQHAALIGIAQMPEGMIFVARHENMVVGYVTFHRPEEYTRWYQHPDILEMGGIEVSPEWRKLKLGLILLKESFAYVELEKNIVITMEFCWHWDLRNSGLDVWQYQRMLTSMFSRAGLSKITTDDPDIIEHPANVLMAQIGKKVDPEAIKQFEGLRFTRFTQ